MRLLDRRRALMAAGGKTPLLPPEYQQVAWILLPSASTGYAGFATGEVAKYNTELGVRLANSSGVNRNYVMCRPQNSGATNAYGIAYLSSTTMFGFGFFGTWYQGIPIDDDFHDFVISNDGLLIDGVSYGTPSVSSGTTGKPIVLLAENGASMQAGHSQKFAYAYIKQAGVLKGQYYPCYRKSDDVIGLYNTVSNSFITKSGNLSVTKGPDVN